MTIYSPKLSCIYDKSPSKFNTPQQDEKEFLLGEFKRNTAPNPPAGHLNIPYIHKFFVEQI